jgi:ribA/ribD-fused uncharacterized protein
MIRQIVSLAKVPTGSQDTRRRRDDAAFLRNKTWMNIYDVEGLKTASTSGWRAEFLFFWGHTPKDARIGKHVLSQWWPAAFSIDNHRYSTAEHYMMAQKAKLFGDKQAFAAIIASQSPSDAKDLGRKVRDFDESIWSNHRFDIAVRGNTAKFHQNTELRDWLLGTGTQVLVEASPTDKIWGIGLAADDKRAQDPRTWQGLNLLGFALMKVRAALA